MGGFDPEVTRVYGNRVRVRACGICLKDERLLLVEHALTANGTFWAPPGGGVEFGESLESTLQREFQEETGLVVSVGAFRFGCELIQGPMHAVELFFDVTAIGGSLRTGHDPELPILRDARYFDFNEMKSLEANELHWILTRLRSFRDLGELAGFHRI